MPILVPLVFTLTLAVPAVELRLSHTRESLTGTHRHYRQYIDGVELIGTSVVESRGARRGLVAVEHATAGTPRAAGVFAIQIDGAIRFVRRSIVYARPLAPYAHYTDIQTGEVVRVEPLFYEAVARVFDPNPVATLNDPSLRDRGDAADAVPEAAYREVDLGELPAEGPLRGPHATIVDTDPPAAPPVSVSGTLRFDRSGSEFEDVNAYYHVDRTQRYLQSLGFSGPRGIAPYSIPIDTHAAGGTDRSFFLPSPAEIGRGVLYFGEGGTDDAEDADIVTHEYGHALLEWISPGAFAGPQASESRAISEGFCDYLAFSSSYAGTVASGRDPACFADWDVRCTGDDPSQACAYPTEIDCLRRVDSMKTFADYIRSDAPGVEHRNGEIWAATLRDLFLDLIARHGFEEGKRRADTLVVESLFGTPVGPSFRSMAGQLITADTLLYGGVHQASICTAVTLRGILQPQECDRKPRGERTLVQSGEQGLAIPDDDDRGIVSTLFVDDDRTIERLSVQVNVRHTARGDLRITLVAPDGTRVLLQRHSFDRTRDLVATYGLDTQPAQSLEVLRGKAARGTWMLEVADVLRRDAGSLLSWGLVIQFAGEGPLDARPRFAHRWLIPVVAHTRGANGTLFATDARVFNGGTRSAEAMLIFTPSGRDGTEGFAAARVSIAAGQVVALGDLVVTLFQTAGTGQLEITSDSPDLAVTSRTFTRDMEGATVGQFVPAASETTALAAEALYVHQLEVSDAFRSNLGFAEASGAAGVVRVQLSDAATGAQTTAEFPITPFGHVQIPISVPGTWLASIVMASGTASVAAYGSVIDNRSGDAIYMPATRPLPKANLLAPAISAGGINGTTWRSDLLLTDITRSAGPIEIRYVNAQTRGERSVIVSGRQRLEDVVGSTFESPSSIGTLFIPALPAGFLATSRVWTPYGTGSVGQFVPLLQASGASLELLHIENSPGARTNVGIIAGEDAEVVVRVLDASGDLLQERGLILGPRQLVQFPVSVPVVNGRVSVIARSGRIVAYASVVDNISGDAIFVVPASLRP